MSKDNQAGLVAELNQRLTQLEIRLSYQDESIEAMESTLASQHQSIQQLNRKLTLLGDYLKSLKDDAIKPLSEETPPPHY